MWPVINDVETGTCPQYPDLEPQRFEASRTDVFEVVQAVARQQARWRITRADAGEGVLEAVRSSRLLRFKDDVTVRVESGGDGQTWVSVRSKSRLGRGDLGQNARTIRGFQRALAAALGKR